MAKTKRRKPHSDLPRVEREVEDGVRDGRIQQKVQAVGVVEHLSSVLSWSTLSEGEWRRKKKKRGGGGGGIKT